MKNSKIDNNFYKLGKNSLIANENKIAKVYFESVNNESKDAIDMELGFSLKTKYYNEVEETEDMWISGPTNVEYYYIKSLDTETVIIESTIADTGPILASFVYDNLVYNIIAIKLSYNIEDVHNILDSYSKS